MNVLEVFDYRFLEDGVVGRVFGRIGCGIIGRYMVRGGVVFMSGGIRDGCLGGMGMGLYGGMWGILSGGILCVV